MCAEFLNVFFLKNRDWISSWKSFLDFFSFFFFFNKNAGNLYSYLTYSVLHSAKWFDILRFKYISLIFSNMKQLNETVHTQPCCWSTYCNCSANSETHWVQFSLGALYFWSKTKLSLVNDNCYGVIIRYYLPPNSTTLKFWLVGCLVHVLWHINPCGLFNAKSCFYGMYMICLVIV